MSSEISKSEIEHLIPPEIKDDELYLAIQKIAANNSIKTILEIGSSSGEGSTQALVAGMQENSSQPSLFCLEISQARFAQLQKHYHNNSFVRCYNASSVSLEKFPKEIEIREFYQNTQTALNNYPVEQVIGWLQQDIQYLSSQEIQENGIQIIKQENQINYFDFVLIDGSEFTGIAELDEIYGANFIALDDINTFKNHSNYHKLLADKNYILIAENYSLRHGYAIFQKNQPNSHLPIHFFTIVLNGEPFIRYHLDIFKQLPFKWHWHIVEGVAELNHDTAWSINNGGRIANYFHNQGLSNDGTSEYLDELVQLYPQNITLYRQPEGIFWDGKQEMVNAPLANISEECLLWQVDADELWTVEQIKTAWQMFVKYPEKRAAFYWCQYFVGDNLMVSTRDCYSQNPDQEWQRTWRFKPGGFWQTHEPPRLVELLPDGELQNLAEQDIFDHAETEKAGLVFQHFAYVILEQLHFKEHYYGYQNAIWEWVNLQEQTNFPLKLRDYFSWVSDDKTMVDLATNCGVMPLASKEQGSDRWLFTGRKDLPQPATPLEQSFPKIIIDGVYFQFFHTEINLAWQSWLEEWQNSIFAQHIVFLDRGGTAPKFSGIRCRSMPLYATDKAGSDAKILDRICEEEKADLFISSYYTAPILTPYILILGDLPELTSFKIMSSTEREKYYAILYAYAFVGISEDITFKLMDIFPHISLHTVTTIDGGEKTGSQTAATLAKTFIQVAKQAKNDNKRQIPFFWKEFRQMQGQLQQTKANLERSQTQRQQVQTELERSQTQLQQTQAELHQAQQEILGMKSSKFWQMRSQWFKLRRALGLKSE